MCKLNPDLSQIRQICPKESDDIQRMHEDLTSVNRSLGYYNIKWIVNEHKY
jgi:hypothetical protein